MIVALRRLDPTEVLGLLADSVDVVNRNHPPWYEELPGALRDAIMTRFIFKVAWIPLFTSMNKFHAVRNEYENRIRGWASRRRFSCQGP